MKDLKTNPKDLTQAIEFLTEWYGDNTSFVTDLPESTYVLESHHHGGRMLRNHWQLWNDEPGQVTDLAQFFIGLGVVHPDDMSAIVTRSLHRTLSGVPIDLDDQVKAVLLFYQEGY